MIEYVGTLQRLDSVRIGLHELNGAQNWTLRVQLGPFQPHDIGKQITLCPVTRVYQMENDEQRAGRLAKRECTCK